jgi:hypothetical protein
MKKRYDLGVARKVYEELTPMLTARDISAPLRSGV